ncbi:oxidoreductase [Sneathiella chinensis]|uniref:Oxidoreductase n=1 Tax=Sneathiella chinensis TaxID=349750 RepID=A0ABQ5U3S4_9PROT|nr:oxidoreductase [Sneathiella chinensis]
MIRSQLSGVKAIKSGEETVLSEKPSVWIIGGSSGIGRHLALELAGRDQSVVVSARRQSALEELASQKPDHLRAVPLDIADEEQVRSVADALFKEGRGPDCVILNAGIYEPMSVQNYSAARARKVMDINYLGLVRVIEAVLPHFQAEGRGHLVIVASVAGYQGLPLSLAYGPSKAALINHCEALRVELAGTDIRVQVVNPGFVRTPLTSGNRFPMPFLMEPEEAARRIVRGMASNRFEIAFPTRFVFLLKLMKLLPYALSLYLVRRATRK